MKTTKTKLKEITICEECDEEVYTCRNCGEHIDHPIGIDIICDDDGRHYCLKECLIEVNI